MQQDVEIAIADYLKQDGLTAAAREEVTAARKLLRERVRALCCMHLSVIVLFAFRRIFFRGLGQMLLWSLPVKFTVFRDDITFC